MKSLSAYGRMAERHWREYCPKLVAQLEAQGRLHQMLLEAEDRTETELDHLRRLLLKQGLTAAEAHAAAWEVVRERYIFLPAEN
jgi:hypothetical protein